MEITLSHTIGLASGETFPKVGWVREVMVVTKGVKRGAMKVICGTSSYDYGTLRYVEEMFL